MLNGAVAPRPSLIRVIGVVVSLLCIVGTPLAFTCTSEFMVRPLGHMADMPNCPESQNAPPVIVGDCCSQASTHVQAFKVEQPEGHVVSLLTWSHPAIGASLALGGGHRPAPQFIDTSPHDCVSCTVLRI